MESAKASPLIQRSNNEAKASMTRRSIKGNKASTTRRSINEAKAGTRSPMGAGGLILDPALQRILVVKGFKWSLPKGHLEHGETVKRGAEREIFEETSLRIKLSPMCRSRKIRHYVYFYMILSNADDLDLAPLDEQEIKEIKWCSHEELRQMDCNKQLRYFVDNWSLVQKSFIEHYAELSLTATVPTSAEREHLRQILTPKVYVPVFGDSPLGVWGQPKPRYRGRVPLAVS